MLRWPPFQQKDNKLTQTDHALRGAKTSNSLIGWFLTHWNCYLACITIHVGWKTFLKTCFVLKYLRYILDGDILITAMPWKHFLHLFRDCNNSRSRNDGENTQLSPFPLSPAHNSNLSTTINVLIVKEKLIPIKSRGTYS